VVSFPDTAGTDKGKKAFLYIPSHDTHHPKGCRTKATRGQKHGNNQMTSFLKKNGL